MDIDKEHTPVSTEELEAELEEDLVDALMDFPGQAGDPRMEAFIEAELGLERRLRRIPHIPRDREPPGRGEGKGTDERD